jgi:proteasome accessory factor B
MVDLALSATGINRLSVLNLNETVALYFAARLLAHHSDENNPHVDSALDKLAASLPMQRSRSICHVPLQPFAQTKADQLRSDRGNLDARLG